MKGKQNKCDILKSLRLPSFLVNKIEEMNNIPKCKTESDKYRFFIDTGLQAYEEFQKTLTDPNYKKQAVKELENIFIDGLIIENLMNMEPSKLKGLSMAADLVRSKRKI